MFANIYIFYNTCISKYQQEKKIKALKVLLTLGYLSTGHTKKLQRKKCLLKHQAGNCPLISQSCDSEAVIRGLIEILGTHWLPKGIIGLFAGVVWQKDTNIWLWFIFSIASCAKLQHEVYNSSDNSEMRSEN